MFSCAITSCTVGAGVIVVLIVGIDVELELLLLLELDELLLLLDVGFLPEPADWLRRGPALIVDSSNVDQ